MNENKTSPETLGACNVAFAPPGCISFVTGPPALLEVLRFEPDGRAYVRGELVTDNFTVFGAFKAWLETANIK